MWFVDGSWLQDYRIPLNKREVLDPFSVGFLHFLYHTWDSSRNLFWIRPAIWLQSNSPDLSAADEDWYWLKRILRSGWLCRPVFKGDVVRWLFMLTRLPYTVEREVLDPFSVGHAFYTSLFTSLAITRGTARERGSRRSTAQSMGNKLQKVS